MFETLYDSGINTVLYLQSLGEWLLSPMQFFSFLGREEFFILFMPALYWSINAILGLRVGVILLISNGLNAVFKMVFQGPRPYWHSRDVRAYAIETSFGIPSAHAQNAASVWLLVASSLRRTWAWILLSALVFLIGISRTYLGVHFLFDVAIGWLFGIFLLWLFLRLEAPVMAWFTNQTIVMRLLNAFLASFVLIVLGIAARASADVEIPPAWIENAAAAHIEAAPIEPLSLEAIFTSAGALFGFAAGAILLYAYGGFDTSGPWTMRLLRYPVGLVGVLILWYGLGQVFPRGDSSLAYSLRYLRYFLIGIWISALAPLLFIRLRMAGRSSLPIKNSEGNW